MLRGLGCCLLLLALLSALNVHWVAVQGVAWANMLSEERQKAASFREAVENTFGGEYPCEWCGVVKKYLELNAAEKAARSVEYQSVKLIPLQSERIRPEAPHERNLALRLEKQCGSYERQRPETPPPRLA